MNFLPMRKREKISPAPPDRPYHIHFNELAAYKPAPLFLLRNFRRLDRTEYNAICCASAKHNLTKLGWLKLLRRYLNWLYKFLPQALSRLHRHGRNVRKLHGRGYARQFADMAILANRGNILPDDYYEMGLARHSGSPAIMDYISNRMYFVGVKYCEACREGNDTETLDTFDKHAFERHCNMHAMPHVETLAIMFPDGPPDIPTLEAGLGDFDLFIKPNANRQGKHTSRALRVGPGRYRTNNGETLSSRQLLEKVHQKAVAVDDCMIIQRMLRNHPALEAMVGTSLSTARIISIMNENAEPEVVFSCLRTPGDKNSIVDNYHSDGIAFPLDLATGRIRPGRRLDFVAEPRFFSVHPLTGARMEGEYVPYWKEALELAGELHRRLPNLIVAGWDIAFTPDGPCVIEVNNPPGFAVVQMEQGVLNTRYSALLAHHILRCLDENEPEESKLRVGVDR